MSPKSSRWFQNVKSGQPFDAGRQSTDYSLQIEVGISNFNKPQPVVNATSPQDRTIQLRKVLEGSDPRSPRDGAPTQVVLPYFRARKIAIMTLRSEGAAFARSAMPAARVIGRCPMSRP